MGKLHGARSFRNTNQNPTEKQGLPWAIVARFTDFEGADSRRNMEIKRSGKTADVKVNRLKSGFVVKVRDKAAVIAA
jgi:hypothetical protein